MANTKKILVIRNDKLGDFMLAWPAFALLKQQYPDYEITALVPAYTAPMAEQCEWIDRILIDTKIRDASIKDILGLSGKIKAGHFDASISLFSEARTAIALWLAGIKTRVGPATKLAQLFLNKRLQQKRSLSLKPEYEYNLDLARYYIQLNSDICSAIPQPPYLTFDRTEIHELKHKYLDHYRIPEAAKIIIIHPGSGGSAINLSIEQYAALAQKIADQCHVFFVITCGPGEQQTAEKLSGLLAAVDHCVHQSTD
ncbi:MAG: glycosyltransferase family 9 protein, partial [Gammaproteobacteria bacterium]|nr:glycosyltransferase family 9 protein [Gammaproteobacteria bacterium]